MPESVDIILKIVLPQMAAHVPGSNGLALRHLAMTTEDQGLFKGVVAVPTGERRKGREPVVGSCRSDEVFVGCDGDRGEFVFCGKELEGEWRLLFRGRCAGESVSRKTGILGFLVGLAVVEL